MRLRPVTLALILLGSTLPLGQACAADGTAGRGTFEVERELPIHISADRIELDQKTGMAYYRGHVTFVQGGLTITAAKAQASTRNNTVQTISAEGNPITFFQKVPPPGQDIQGQALRLKYFAPQQRLDLHGMVRFRQGSDSLHSDTLDYNMATGTMTAVSTSPRSQVHVVIRPRTTPSGPANTGPAKIRKRP